MNCALITLLCLSLPLSYGNLITWTKAQPQSLPSDLFRTGNYYFDTSDTSNPNSLNYNSNDGKGNIAVPINSPLKNQQYQLVVGLLGLDQEIQSSGNRSIGINLTVNVDDKNTSAFSVYVQNQGIDQSLNKFRISYICVQSQALGELFLVYNTHISNGNGLIQSINSPYDILNKTIDTSGNGFDGLNQNDIKTFTMFNKFLLRTQRQVTRFSISLYSQMIDSTTFSVQLSTSMGALNVDKLGYDTIVINVKGLSEDHSLTLQTQSIPLEQSVTRGAISELSDYTLNYQVSFFYVEKFYFNNTTEQKRDFDITSQLASPPSVEVASSCAEFNMAVRVVSFLTENSCPNSNQIQYEHTSTADSSQITIYCYSSPPCQDGQYFEIIDCLEDPSSCSPGTTDDVQASCPSCQIDCETCSDSITCDTCDQNMNREMDDFLKRCLPMHGYFDKFTTDGSIKQVAAPCSDYCGNGTRDQNQCHEECDDGNQKDGDGCSSQCQVEAPDYECLHYQDTTAHPLVEQQFDSQSICYYSLPIEFSMNSLVKEEYENLLLIELEIITRQQRIMDFISSTIEDVTKGVIENNVQTSDSKDESVSMEIVNLQVTTNSEGNLSLKVLYHFRYSAEILNSLYTGSLNVQLGNKIRTSSSTIAATDYSSNSTLQFSFNAAKTNQQSLSTHYSSSSVYRDLNEPSDNNLKIEYYSEFLYTSLMIWEYFWLIAAFWLLVLAILSIVGLKIIVVQLYLLIQLTYFSFFYKVDSQQQIDIGVRQISSLRYTAFVLGPQGLEASDEYAWLGWSQKGFVFNSLIPLIVMTLLFTLTLVFGIWKKTSRVAKTVEVLTRFYESCKYEIALSLYAIFAYNFTFNLIQSITSASSSESQFSMLDGLGMGLGVIFFVFGLIWSAFYIKRKHKFQELRTMVFKFEKSEYWLNFTIAQIWLNCLLICIIGKYYFSNIIVAAVSLLMVIFLKKVEPFCEYQNTRPTVIHVCNIVIQLLVMAMKLCQESQNSESIQSTPDFVLYAPKIIFVILISAIIYSSVQLIKKFPEKKDEFQLFLETEAQEKFKEQKQKQRVYDLDNEQDRIDFENAKFNPHNKPHLRNFFDPNLCLSNRHLKERFEDLPNRKKFQQIKAQIELSLLNKGPQTSKNSQFESQSFPMKKKMSIKIENSQSSQNSSPYDVNQNENLQAQQTSSFQSVYTPGEPDPKDKELKLIYEVFELQQKKFEKERQQKETQRQLKWEQYLEGTKQQKQILPTYSLEAYDAI